MILATMARGNRLWLFRNGTDMLWLPRFGQGPSRDECGHHRGDTDESVVFETPPD